MCRASGHLFGRGSSDRTARLARQRHECGQMQALRCHMRMHFDAFLVYFLVENTISDCFRVHRIRWQLSTSFNTVSDVKTAVDSNRKASHGVGMAHEFGALSERATAELMDAFHGGVWQPW